jgi:hypothetical protein
METHTMKSIISAAALAFSLIVAGGSVGVAQEPTSCATPAPTDLLNFEGETATVTDPFVLSEGVYVVKGTHRGESNFIVIPFSPEGRMTSIFNEAGVYEGEATLAVEPGTKIVLDVQADGPWTLEIAPAF